MTFTLSRKVLQGLLHIRMLRWGQVLLSLGLIVAFSQPWVTGLGGPASASQLQERLAGPQKIVSLISRKNRVTKVYHLAGKIWMLRFAEILSAVGSLWPSFTGWPGLLVGLSATGIAHWTESEIKSFPFQKPGWGMELTYGLGWLLSALSGVRILRERFGKK